MIRTNARALLITNKLNEAAILTRRYLLTSSQARRLPVSKSESEFKSVPRVGANSLLLFVPSFEGMDNTYEYME